MLTYITRRLLLMIPTMLGITFLVFGIIALAPGGIGAALQQGGGGGLQASSGVAVQQAYLEDRYGLNDPVVVQYARWLARVSPIKFGRRDQVLPSGELLHPPKPTKVPVLWSWFADHPPAVVDRPVPALPPAPEQTLLALRKLERRCADARFELLTNQTLLRTQLTAYAREVGIVGAVGPDGKPIIEQIARATPRRDAQEWAKLAEMGREGVSLYEQAEIARAELDAFMRAGPLPEAGWGISGVVSLAWPDLGVAFSKTRPVTEMIAEALPVTLSLNLVAIPIIYFISVPTGVLAAVRRGSIYDAGLGTLYIALFSFPVVLAATLAQGYLASRDYLDSFPVAGLSSGASEAMAFLPGDGSRGWLIDRAWHMVLPVLCLVYGGFAVISKQARAAMLENFSMDYVRTAKAKGVSGWEVVVTHVLRNSLIPLITIFVSVFPAMLAGSVVIERIFTIPGMGSLILEAIASRDTELILANTVIVAGVNMLALLLADVLYALADPRVTYE